MYGLLAQIPPQVNGIMGCVCRADSIYSTAVAVAGLRCTSEIHLGPVPRTIMRSIRLHIAMLLFSMSGFAGCDQIEGPFDPEYLLVGDWKWEYSIGGWGGYLTPQSSGSRMTMAISSHETVVITYNDTTRRSYPCTVDWEPRPYDGVRRTVFGILYDHGPSFDEVLFSHPDTLTLMPIDAFDAKTRTFSRIKK